MSKILYYFFIPFFCYVFVVNIIAGVLTYFPEKQNKKLKRIRRDACDSSYSFIRKGGYSKTNCADLNPSKMYECNEGTIDGIRIRKRRVK